MSVKLAPPEILQVKFREGGSRFTCKTGGGGDVHGGPNPIRAELEGRAWPLPSEEGSTSKAVRTLT